MTPVGRAYQEGQLQNHLQQQEQLQRHARPTHRSGHGDEEALGSGGDSASGAGPLASARTDTTTSTVETVAAGTAAAGPERSARHNSGSQKQQRHHQKQQQQQPQPQRQGRRRRKHRPRPSFGVISSSENSEDGGSQGSLSSSIGSLGEASGASAVAEGGDERVGRGSKKKKRHSHGKSGHGGRRGSGAGAGAGGSKRRVSISAKETLGSIFDDGGAPAPSGVQFSRYRKEQSLKSNQFLRVCPRIVLLHTYVPFFAPKSSIIRRHHYMVGFHGDRGRLTPQYYPLDYSSAARQP